MTDNALHSLYGKGHMSAKQFRECVAMPGTRDQVVLSPGGIKIGLDLLWPEGVAYDPAGPSGQEAIDKLVVRAERSTTTRGLMDAWPHRTYCNPPFGSSLFDPENELGPLTEELRIRAEAKAAGEKNIKWPPGLPVKKAGLWNWLTMHIDASEGESVMLVPNRTNRKWLRAWRRDMDGLVELDPLTFIGHKQAFPATLVLGFLGPAERVSAFHAAFSHLGDPA